MTKMPTWPVLIHEWGAPYTANGGTPAGQNVDITDRVLTSASTKRGKQYELDSAQAGELSTTLRNNDAVLDPTNSAGPYAGRILPYQPLRIRAQYPPTANLLPFVVATGGEGFTTGTIPRSFGISSGTDVTGGQIVAPGDARQGTNVFQFVVPLTSGAGTFIMSYGISAAPLTQYTLQAAIRNIATSTTGPAKLAVGFYGPNFSDGPASWIYGPLVNLPGVASGGAWFEETLTFTTPANVCGMAIGVVTGATASAVWNLQIDSIQPERGATASAFAAPGNWYTLFSGFIERWPTQWKSSGEYGTVAPTVTDALALLSQGQLNDPLTEELRAAGATWIYRLDDPDNSSQASEASGKYPPLNVVSGKYGPGSLTFGNEIDAATASGVFNSGSANGSACVSLAPAVVSGIGSQPYSASMLSLDGSGIRGPANPLLWTRMIAFRWTGATVPANFATVWTSFDQYSNGAGSYQLQLVTGGGTDNWVAFSIQIPDITAGNVGFDANGPISVAPAGFNAFDGNWHLVIFGYNDLQQNAFCSVDGVTTGMTQLLGSDGWTPKIVKDTLGGWLTAGGEAFNEFTGDIAYAAEFPTNLTATQIQQIYAAWRNACSGESSAARYSRILRYAGYTGPTNVGAGCLTQDMGPATDLDGSDALSCLENVVTTEFGTHFAAADGTITFQGRGFRYNTPAPAYTFGEAAGEFPYEDLQLDYDTTHLANDATVTQNSTGQNFYATDATAEAAYFDRTLTRTINVNSAFEAQDCANFLVGRYKNPMTRVSLLTLNPAGQPSLWPVALSLELGMCIRVNRRPFGCPTISLLMWIEQMQWDIDDSGTATLQLQCSPVDSTPQAQFAIWHTTLAAQATAGATSLTINAPQDNINPLAAQLLPGMTFQIHTNNPVPFENVTIKSVSSSGGPWTTGTITFTPALAFTHPAGTTCGEPSNGITDLTTYQSNAAFNSAVFTY